MCGTHTAIERERRAFGKSFNVIGSIDSAYGSARELANSLFRFDKVEILSGVYEGKTTGTPIALLIRNVDQR